MTMTTDQLIESLVADTPPVRGDVVMRRLMIGLGVGAVITAVAVLLVLGLRADFMLALGGPMIWVKWGYTLWLGIVAAIGLRAVARPGGHIAALKLAALPVALLAIVAAVQLAAAPFEGRGALWMGHSWRECPGRVVALALPIFAGLLWSFRGFAPTRLRLAGAVAGLAAGAFAATLYGFACAETSALFVVTWYSLGIVAVAALGAMVGPWVLRW